MRIIAIESLGKRRNLAAMVSRNRGQEEKNRKRNDEIETITKNSYYDTNITNIGYTLEV